MVADFYLRAFNAGGPEDFKVHLKKNLGIKNWGVFNPKIQGKMFPPKNPGEFSRFLFYPSGVEISDDFYVIPNRFDTSYVRSFLVFQTYGTCTPFSLLLPQRARQLVLVLFWSNYSDLTRPGPPKGSCLEGNWDPLFQGNLGWYIYLHLADFYGKYVGRYNTSPMDLSWVIIWPGYWMSRCIPKTSMVLRGHVIAHSTYPGLTYTSPPK